MVNWNLGLAPDVGGMFQQGFAVGQEKARVNKASNALAEYAKNPQSQFAVNALLEADPRMGMQAMEQQRKQAEQVKLQELGTRAASGDHAALLELAGKDPENFARVHKVQLDQAKRATDFLGNVGLDISQTPEEQRAAKWQAYVRQAEASGMDIPTQYEQYSPQALDGIIAEAGQAKQLFDMLKIDWKVRPEGAALIPMDAMGRRLDMPQGGPIAQPQQDAPLSEQEGAQIISAAQQSSTISASDAARVRASLGPNGDAAFNDWMRQHNIRIEGAQTASAAPPAGFVLDN